MGVWGVGATYAFRILLQNSRAREVLGHFPCTIERRYGVEGITDKEKGVGGIRRKGACTCKSDHHIEQEEN